MTITVSGDVDLDDIKDLAITHFGHDLTLYIPGDSYCRLLTNPVVGEMLVWTSPLEITEPAIRLWGVKVTPYKEVTDA